MDGKLQKLKIAVLVDSYTHGGVAMVLQSFLQFLPKARYDITLFVRLYEEGNMLPLPEGVSCRPWTEGTIPAPLSRLRVLLNWRNFGKKQIFQARCRKELPGEYDCVIGYHMVANDLTVMALEKIQAKRKILWLHGQKNFREKDLAFYDQLYSKADHIVCVSLDTEDRFRKLMPKSAEKTVTIHNLYDLAAIQKQATAPAEGLENHPGTWTIVSVGRISKEKGFDRVPPVAQALRDAGYDFHWYIIGDGNTRASVEADIRAKSLQDCVHLMGHRANPYPYIQNCHIYVQPSYTEGFCTSTMEAKILGKPVVTTDVPGMREQFVSGENGLIVESSAEGICEGIRQLLDNPELIQKIENRLRSKPVTNEQALKQTMAVIDGIPME